MLTIMAWGLLALALVDALAQMVFPMPRDPRTRPSTLAQYFDYGRSVESKLNRLLGPDDSRSAPIVVAGWPSRDCNQVPAAPAPGKTGVTVYGMSFSARVAAQLEKLDPALTTTNYAGPGAPPNHSYACFLEVQKAGTDPNRVQVLAVLASAVPQLLTIGGLTTSFEAPAPFTYPRYRLEQGKLVATQPAITAPEQLRDPALRAAYRAQLAQHDAFYEPWLFDGGWADNSVTLRMMRRAMAQSHDRSVRAHIVDPQHGFADNPDLGPVLQAILRDFAARTRARGQLPVVLLLQDRGAGADSLYRLVGPALERDGVTVVSSHSIASANNPGNFLPDGHFTAAVDRRIAEATLKAIRKSLD